jgi:DegV family protein with EDD domain
MNIKIVTDSTSDIPPEMARELGITVLPAYIHFDNEVYRDGVDLTKDGFYHKLINSFVQPTTSEPTPEDFIEAYYDCAKDADGIISIHISAKISETYRSALQGKKMLGDRCHLEVMDSHLTSVGLGLLVMAAARMASRGGDLHQIFEDTRKLTDRISMLGLFDTMKYLYMGGRAREATASVSRMFNIKPLLAFQNGEVIRSGLVRTYSAGVERLYEFLAERPSIDEMSIAYSTGIEEAEKLAGRLASVSPRERIHLMQLGAAIGVHSGPGAMVVAFRGAR